MQMLRKSLVLVGGGGIAQLVSFASLPLLSRLYDPAQFGFFAIVSSICWLGAVFATFQLEHAIVLPKLEKTAHSLVASILVAGFFVSAFIGILFCVASFNVPALRYAEVSPYLLASLSVATIFGIVCTQALRALLVRTGQFRLVAQGAVITAIMTAATAILAACVVGDVLDDVGLIIAQGVGLLTTAVFWISAPGRSRPLGLSRFRFYRLLATLRRYRKFAFLLTASNAVKTTYGRLPTIIVSLVGGPVAAGLYGLVERVISAPSVLLAQAVASAFRHQAGQYAKVRDTRQIMRAYWKVVLISGLFVVPVFSVAAWLAPILFRLVFGEEWEKAGSYAAILLVGEAFVFVLAMVEDTSILMGKNKYRLLWHVGQLLSVGSVLMLAHWGKMPDIEGALWSLVSIRIAFSLLDLVFFYQVMLRYRSDQKEPGVNSE